MSAWTMTEDGEWVLNEPYKTHSEKCKRLAADAFVDAACQYLSQKTGYSKYELIDALNVKSARTDNRSTIIDEFVIQALEGDL